MIKKQFQVVKQEVSNQARAIFKVERRKNLAKRQFIESIFLDSDSTLPREQIVTIITLTLARCRDLWKSTKSSEAVWHVMSDSGTNRPKEIKDEDCME